MMKRFSQISFILGILVFVTGVQPVLADTTNYTIDILNGSGGGFSYSSIHAGTGCPSGTLRMCGPTYGSLTGQLIADKDNTTHALSNLHGMLDLNGVPTLHLTNGVLDNTGGSFDYSLIGGTLDGESGTFYFSGGTVCCSTAPNDGPNNFNANGFTLWGNNWIYGQTGPSNGGTALGIDLVGGNYTTTPEPSTMMLLGSGLLALPFLRKKKR